MWSCRWKTKAVSGFLISLSKFFKFCNDTQYNWHPIRIFQYLGKGFSFYQKNFCKYILKELPLFSQNRLRI